MKIGVSTLGGSGGRAGVSPYIVQLLRIFAAVEQRTEFEILCFEDEKDLYVPKAKHMAARTFSDELRPSLKNILWHRKELRKLCAEQQYDALFLPAGNKRLPFRVSCPTIATVHDFSPMRALGHSDPINTFYIRRVLPRLARRLSRVITASEFSKNDVVTYSGISADRVTVVPLAADTRVFYPRLQEAAWMRLCWRYGIEPPYILCVSRIEHPGKNHVRIIEAFTQLKTSEGIPHQLVLAGVDWYGAEEVHRLAEGSRFCKDIVFTGFVPPEQMPDLYAGASIFVLPSFYENFGVQILEAMASGVPVACSNLAAMPEVAGDAALLFDPSEDELILHSIRRLLTEEGLRESCVRKGLARAKQYSWDRTAAHTIQVIRAAAEEGAR